jgi:hypothetical protein
MLLGVVSALAVPITILNPGFEDISGQPTLNEFTLVLPNGWTAYNPSNLISGSGLYFGTLEVDGTFFDAASEGSRVAILYNQNQKGAGEYGLEQTLTETLQPLTRYILEVETGNIGSGTADNGDYFDLEDFPGYRIDLFAGTNLLASDNNTLTIPERTFSNAVLQVIAGQDSPGIGEPLMIRLVSLNSPLEPDDNSAPYDAHEVDFDDVRLDAELVPELFSTSNGATYAMLINAGLATSTSAVSVFESASLVNTDGDIHLDWQEFITGTDPSNSASYFTVSISNTPAPQLLWNAVSNRSYGISLQTNLITGSMVLTNGLSAGSFTDVAGNNRPTGFYRVDVVFP